VAGGEKDAAEENCQEDETLKKWSNYEIKYFLVFNTKRMVVLEFFYQVRFDQKYLKRPGGITLKTER